MSSKTKRGTASAGTDSVTAPPYARSMTPSPPVEVGITRPPGGVPSSTLTPALVSLSINWPAVSAMSLPSCTWYWPGIGRSGNVIR